MSSTIKKKEIEDKENSDNEYFENVIKDELQYEKNIKVITDIKQYCDQNALQICEYLDLEMFEYFISYINENT